MLALAERLWNPDARDYAAGRTDAAHQYHVQEQGLQQQWDLATLDATKAEKLAYINGKIELAAIPLGGSAVTARKIYRQFNSTGTFKLQSTISNNTATTLTDNTANASLGADAPTANTTADPELVSWILAAREYGETCTHRAFITQTWEWKRGGFPCDDVIWIPKPPLVSVTSVTYVDPAGVTQTWSASLYTVDAPSGPKARAGRIVPNYGEIFPATRDVVNAVTIRFVAGYGAASVVPSLLKTCLKELTRAYRLRGEADAGIAILNWVDRQLWAYKAF